MDRFGYGVGFFWKGFYCIDLMFVYFLQAENGYVDFSDVIVGSSACKQITLFNNSACSLHYRLSVDQTLDGPYPEEITRSDSFGKYWML